MPRSAPRPPWRLLAAPLLALTALFPWSGAGAAHPVSPKSLALRPGDVPSGYGEVRGAFVSTGQAANAQGTTAAVLKSHGRIAGYETEFRQASFGGIIDIADDVSSYRDTGGAHWGYGRLLSAARTIAHRHANFKSLAVGQIGDERTGYTYSTTVSQFQLTADAITFRRGPYVVAVTVIGIAGTFGPSSIESFARIIDRRIQKSG